MAGVGHAMLPGLLVLLLARLSLEQGISIRKVTLRFSDCMPAFLRLRPTRQTSHVTRFHTSLSHELRDRSGLSRSMHLALIFGSLHPLVLKSLSIAIFVHVSKTQRLRMSACKISFFDIYIQPGRAELQASL